MSGRKEAGGRIIGAIAIVELLEGEESITLWRLNNRATGTVGAPVRLADARTLPELPPLIRAIFRSHDRRCARDEIIRKPPILSASAITRSRRPRPAAIVVVGNPPYSASSSSVGRGRTDRVLTNSQAARRTRRADKRSPPFVREMAIDPFAGTGPLIPLRKRMARVA